MPPQVPTSIYWRSYRRPRPPVARYVPAALWTGLMISLGLTFGLLYYSVNYSDPIAQLAI
jgi:hypothetical protein